MRLKKKSKPSCCRKYWFYFCLLVLALLAATSFWWFWELPWPWWTQKDSKNNNDINDLQVLPPAVNHDGNEGAAVSEGTIQIHHDNNNNNSEEANNNNGDSTVQPILNRPNPILKCDYHDSKLQRPTFPNYCQWNTTLQECYEMLMPIFHKQPSWSVLGDSGMALMSYYISLRWPYAFLNITSQRNACNNLQYYDLPPKSNDGWDSPNETRGEGPVFHGKNHPYCMDCRNCWNVLLQDDSITPYNPAAIAGKPPPEHFTIFQHSTSRNSRIQRIKEEQLLFQHQEKVLAARMDDPTTSDAVPLSKSRFVEYLVVEYSRDVSIQSKFTSTTQETVAYHLSRKKPSVCVVASTGILDANIPNITLDIYVQNVDQYLKLLVKSCQHVIWIPSPAIVEPHEESLLFAEHLNNCEIKKWNYAIFALIQLRKFQNVYVIDHWEKSMQAAHDEKNPLYLTKKSYAAMARFFVSLMAGPDMIIN